MRLISQLPKTGKTSALVAWLREDPDERTIVVATERQAVDLRRVHGLNDDQVRSASAMQARPSSKGLRPELAVDELDVVLAILLNRPVKVATLTFRVRDLLPTFAVSGGAVSYGGTVTRTHVRYFSESALEDLDAAILELRRSAAERRLGVDAAAFAALDLRLGLLEAAASLLAEPVPASYGG